GPWPADRRARPPEAADAPVSSPPQAPGGSGFRDSRALAAAAPARTAAGGRGGLPADIGADDAAETVLTNIEAEEHRALADTAASRDVGALTGAADSIASARRTVVAGIGASGLVAVDLATTLERIGLISRAVTEGHMAMTLGVLMSPEDLLIIVSASGETTDMVEPLAAARQSGVPTVAITMRPRSSVTSADHVLIGVAARE